MGGVSGDRGAACDIYDLAEGVAINCCRDQAEISMKSCNPNTQLGLRAGKPGR